MRNLMYLPPGKLLKEFAIEECIQIVETQENTNGRPKTGRPIMNYQKKDETIKAVLADASTSIKWRWNQLGHPVTHTIVQNGKPKAKPEDILITGDRVFAIQGVDDCGGLGISVQYFAEERTGLKWKSNND